MSDTPKTDAAIFYISDKCGGNIQLAVPAEFAAGQERRIAELENRAGGEVLFAGLCRQLIARLAEADVNCDPPTDMLLRLESIIHERDQLRAKCDRLADTAMARGDR